MPIYQCAAPVGLLTRDVKARIAAAISGEIVVPFVAGEVNLVMQPGLSGAPRSRCCSMEGQLVTRAERTLAQTASRASIARE
jgi:hypothetical protein